MTREQNIRKPVSPPTAAEAYLRFIDGDDEAFDQLEKLLSPPATRFAWRLVSRMDSIKHRDELVHDAVQLAFLKIVRQQRRVSGRWSPDNSATSKSKFQAWFFMIVRNQIVSLLRSKSSHYRTTRPAAKPHLDSVSLASVDSNGDHLADQQPDRNTVDPVEVIHSREIVEKLRRCVRNLDPVLRQVIQMVFYEGKQQTEVAIALNTSNASVTRLKQRALEALGRSMVSA